MGKIISINEINRAVMEGKDDLVFEPVSYTHLDGKRGMRRNHQQKHRISGSWKPVTNSTRQNTTWIFCAQVIPMNAPKWSVICLQMVGWTSSRKIAMGGTPREQEVCRA